MITQEQQKQGAELMKTLVEKAWESAAFKDQLVKNPIAAIESVTGKKTKSNYKFIVEDQTDASVIYLNIPGKPNFDSFELTDEQLELISGGNGPAYDLGYWYINKVIDAVQWVGDQFTR